MREMVKRSAPWLSFIFLVSCLYSTGVLAKEVGQFTRVEGKVDLHKKGKPERVAVQPRATAEEQDAVKTEALSRAQIQFLDASTMTVAPLSHVTIESWMYDAKKGECGCLSEITQGLCHLVVSPLAKLQKKEFILKTRTATMGIRGTELYILIGPDFTDVYVKEGTVSAVASQTKQQRSDAGQGNDRYVENLLRQVNIRGVNNQVLVRAMHALRVPGSMIPVRITDAHFRTLEGMMYSGLPPKFPFSSNPGDLLERIGRLGPPYTYTPPAPPAPPGDVGPSNFPGGGGGGGGVVSPSS